MFARKIFALAAVAQTGFAVRLSETDEMGLSVDETDNYEVSEFSNEGAIVDNPTEICGGSKIWDVITWAETDQDGKMDGMKKAVALDGSWDTIEGVKKQFMEMQKKEKTRLEGEVAELQGKLKAESAKESTGKTTTEHHTDLLKAAFDASYGNGEAGKGFDAAFTWGCGATRRVSGERMPRILRHADTLAVEKFEEKATTEYFQKIGAILNEDLFLKDCKAAVFRTSSEEDNFCMDVCQSMKKAAGKASQGFQVTNLGNSDDFKKKIEEAAAELTKVKSSIDSCELDFQTLSGFKDETKSLRLHYSKCGSDFRAARRLLRDVKRRADIVDKNLVEEEAKLKDVTNKLEASKADTKDAVAALEAAKKKSAELKVQIVGLASLLGAMEKNVQTAEDANSKMGDLQAKVTDTMLKMVNWGDAGIRQPLQDVGFYPEQDLEMQDPSSIESANVLHSTLEKMANFCSMTAIPAFLKIKADLDLTPLCSFGKSEDMFKDLTAAVTQRYSSMKSDVELVVDWLNPWKAMKMGVKAGEAKELELVKGGQLMGLEQVKAFYTGPPNDFFPYLIKWRKDGEHHKLLAQLTEHIKQLSAMRDDLKAKLKAAIEASKEATKAREEAAKKLKEAQAKEANNADLKAAVEEALALVEEEGKKLAEDISAFQAKYDEAAAAVKKAEEALAEAYTRLTS